MADKIDPLVAEWAETRLIVPPGIPEKGWFGLRHFYEDYVRVTKSRGRVLPVNIFSMHVRAIPKIDISRNGNGSVLVGAIIGALVRGSDNYPQISHVNRGLHVKLPKRGKRIIGTRTEIYVYRGAMAAAADAVGGDDGEALKRMSVEFDEESMKRFGRMFAKSIKSAKGLT